MKVYDAEMFGDVVETYKVVAALAQNANVTVPAIDELHLEVATVDNFRPWISIFEVDNPPVLQFLAKVWYQEWLWLLVEYDLADRKAVTHFCL